MTDRPLGPKQLAALRERPVIFSAPMVRALILGRKTMTRRLAWKRPVIAIAVEGRPTEEIRDPSPWQRVQPGQRLWVRETFSLDRGGAQRCWWWADGNPEVGDWTKPKPSIHMPRWASRLTLTVTAVRVERVQDISEADAIAEGIEPMVGSQGGPCWRNYGCPEVPDRSPIYSFRTLWQSLHGPGAWEANPEVIALGFTVERLG